MLEAVMLSKPETGPVSEPQQESKLKRAMVAEGALIANSLGYFLPSLAIGIIGTAEIAANPQSWEDISLKVVLMLSVLFLVRVIAKKDEKIEKLYDRLAQKDDDDRNGTKARRARP